MLFSEINRSSPLSRNEKELGLEVQNEFRAALLEIGINALFISLVDRNGSHCMVSNGGGSDGARSCKPVPVLTIYIGTHENYMSLNVDEHNGNWDSSYPRTAEIREIWRGLARKHGIDEESCCDKEMLVFFRDVHEIVLMNLIYENREHVKSFVQGLDVVPPKEIFCCSAPGYNVIYKNESDYARAEQGGQFGIIGSDIRKLVMNVAQADCRHSFLEMVTIRFYHADMQNFNWNGFARQD